MPSLFSAVELAPRDPILGLTEAFNADPRPGKVNLGVGVYYNDDGRIPLLECVKAAERERLQAASPRGYQPIEGPPAYAAQVQRLLFGPDSETAASGRCVTATALGGTGALRIGADLVRRLSPKAAVMISDPSWENHRALFEAAGVELSGSALARLGCNIEVALIDTEGQKAIDVFYLTSQGQKLTAQKQVLLREVLQATLS